MPENTESMLKLSEIHLILKNYKEALENADRAIAVDKSNPLPYFMKGYTFAEAGDTVNAFKSYLEAVDRNQEYYDAYVQLGLIYSISGSQLAIDFFNNALNSKTNSSFFSTANNRFSSGALGSAPSSSRFCVIL